MTTIDLIGLGAAILTSISFIPQAVLVIRTRRTGGISLLMYSVFVIGVALWLVYGIAKADVPMMLANSLTLSLASIILVITAQERLKAKRQKAKL